MRIVAKLCHTSNCCPEIKIDDAADASRQVVMTDDFGGTITISKEQLAILVSKAKAGELDNF